jgi:hypothetical protein
LRALVSWASTGWLTPVRTLSRDEADGRGGGMSGMHGLALTVGWMVAGEEGSAAYVWEALKELGAVTLLPFFRVAQPLSTDTRHDTTRHDTTRHDTTRHDQRHDTTNDTTNDTTRRSESIMA